MSGIIEGYNYDIFISYRQKDNKGEKWVSEFVESLKTELESTFKDEISVYFDINPHDGLLETYDVNESLMNKLKCLVFIPVISRTYCDPKSFAWEYEFMAFIQQASRDKFGLKVKLPNGNVAARVLPIRIHDLDSSDIKLCESVIGSALRGIDFVYSEPGVNRPLSPKDKEEFNLNRTNYRNQINKTANAVKDIIDVTRLSGDVYMTGKKGVDDIDNVNVTAEKSIAVLPFVNMSPEKDQDYFCDGVTEEIINALAQTEGFKVISRTSSFAFKDKNIDVREIGRILNVRNLLEGSIRKAGNMLRITAQLIKVDDGSHIWSERYDREIKDVFAIQDEISHAITETLKVKLSDDRNSKIIIHKTGNLDAYNFYLKGTYYSRMFTQEGFRKATEYYEKALAIDPYYSLPYVGLAEVLGFRTYWGNYKPSETMPVVQQYIEKALKKASTIAEAYALLGNIYLFHYWNINESERNFRYALNINPNSSMIHIDYAIFLRLTGRSEEAASEALKAKELDPLSWYISSRAGDIFTVSGQIDKAIEEYQMSISIRPDYFLTHFQLGLAYFKKKMFLKVITEFEKAYTLSDGNPLVSAALCSAYFRIWKKAKANRILEDLKVRYEVEYIPPSCFFIIYYARGEEEKALDWLKRALMERDTLLPDIRISLLDNPGSSKYLNLMKEMGMDF